MRHPWAITLLDSRTGAGAATFRHHDANVATLRNGGFSLPMTAHAYALIDSYVYGFAVQEAALPFEGPGGAAEVAELMMDAMAPYPHLVEMATEHAMQPGYDFADEFDFGLELILDGVEALIARRASRS